MEHSNIAWEKKLLPKDVCKYEQLCRMPDNVAYYTTHLLIYFNFIMTSSVVSSLLWTFGFVSIFLISNYQQHQMLKAINIKNRQFNVNVLESILSVKTLRDIIIFMSVRWEIKTRWIWPNAFLQFIAHMLE